MVGAPSTNGTSADITFVGTAYAIYGGERLSHSKTSLVLSRTLGVIFGTAMMIFSVFVLAYIYRFRSDDNPVHFSRVSQREGGREAEKEVEGEGVAMDVGDNLEEDEENDDDILYE